jgi:spore coat polysaccharide biosynthesis protein SpsF
MAGHPLIGIVIQARMGSTRLPGKVLMPIGGRSLLTNILMRLTRLEQPVKTVIATSNDSRDDTIAAYGKQHGIAVFRGSEADVLGRYYQCASSFGFNHIVRLTGDNPFVDVEELDRLIRQHLGSKSDYTSSINNLPEGIGAEVFTFAALAASHTHGHAHHHREHVNEYILENPNCFRIAHLAVSKTNKRPDIRLTVDTPDDYHRACRIANAAFDPFFGVSEAIAIVDEIGFPLPESDQRRVQRA